MESENMYETKIKLLNDCCKPDYKTLAAAAADCLANINSSVTLQPMERKLIPLGFALEMPKGMKAMIKPRSGLSSKGIIVWVGTIDNDYRGEVKASVMNLSGEPYEIHPYERIAQIEFEPYIQMMLKPVKELGATERGEGGFGSTGK